MFSLSCGNESQNQIQQQEESCECEEPINVWYKVSTDESTYGQVIALDMSKGQSFTDGQYIYLIMRDLDSKEMVIISFPFAGDWVVDEYDPFLDTLGKEFKDLEDYLKATENKSSSIEKQQ
jgi:hypothetical protein